MSIGGLPDQVSVVLTSLPTTIVGARAISQIVVSPDVSTTGIVIQDNDVTGDELWRIYGGASEFVSQNFGAAIRVPHKQAYVSKTGLGNVDYVSIAYQP